MKHVVLYVGHMYKPFWTKKIWPGWQGGLGKVKIMHLCTFPIEMTQICHILTFPGEMGVFFSLGPLQDPCGSRVKHHKLSFNHFSLLQVSYGAQIFSRSAGWCQSDGGHKRERFLKNDHYWTRKHYQHWYKVSAPVYFPQFWCLKQTRKMLICSFVNPKNFARNCDHFHLSKLADKLL